MNVTLPNGVTIQGVPDNATKDQIRAKAISAGLAKAEDFNAPEKRGVIDELKRTAGRGARYVAEGVSAIPNMITQPIVDVANMATDAMGADRLFQPNQAQALSGFLSKLGLPEDDNAQDRVVGDIVRGLSSGGSILGTAQRLQGPIATALSAAPGMQASGAAGGAAGAGIARENDVGPVGQLLAGLAGGFGAPLAAQGAGALTGAAYRGVKGAVQPFTAGGRERIAGSLLADQADDPIAAAVKLRNLQETVPGSQPTTGAGSRDIGLLAVEKGLRGRNAAAFGGRMSEQNAARQSMLDDIAGTPADIADDVAAREAGTASAREAAFANAKQVDTAPILSKADEILASPAGARKPVQQAVTEFRKSIEGETDPRRLYEIRKDIGDAMSGKYGGEKSAYKLARRELITLRETIDDSIENVAPGFKAYLERYKTLSKPINQKEALQELQNRSALAAPDITTGRDFLSQAKYTRNLDNMLRDPEITRSLTADQIQKAKAVAADLDLAASINSPLIRAPGSDTFQNLSLANIVANAKGSAGNVPPLMKTLTKPFEWLYKYTDDQINELLVEAMLDPKLAGRMLERATTGSAKTLSNNLMLKARQLGMSSTVGATTTTQRQPQPQDKERKPQAPGSL